MNVTKNGMTESEILQKLMVEIERGNEIVATMQGQLANLRSFYRMLEVRFTKPIVDGVTVDVDETTRATTYAVHKPLNDNWVGYVDYEKFLDEGEYGYWAHWHTKTVGPFDSSAAALNAILETVEA